MNFSISTNNPTTLAATAMGSVHCSPFAGKEKDAESGYHYFGARYYDSEALTGWLSVDPMADKYPSISPYASCAWNPIRLIDEDGKEPIGAIVEGISVIGTSMAIDFVYYLLQGQSAGSALMNVDLKSAIASGLTTCAYSFFIDGSGSARFYAKLAKNEKCQVAIKLANDIACSMTSNISAKFLSGEYKSFSDIEFGKEICFAAVEALIGNGFSKRADELIKDVSKTDGKLGTALGKLQRSIDKEKGDVRISHDSDQVKIAKSNNNSAKKAYKMHVAKTQTVKTGASKTLDKVFD